MVKKILCAVLAAMMLLSFVSCASSCKKEEVKGSSSKKKPSSSSSVVVSDVASEEDSTSSSITIADVPTDESSGEDLPYEWTIETKSAFFRDSAEAKSATMSDGIKQYKYNGGLQLGIYHLSAKFCDSAGEDTDSRMQEFADVVNAGYFNTYFLPMDTNLRSEAKLIAEKGGAFWLTAGPFKSSNGQVSVDGYRDRVKMYVDDLTKAGYGDLILGCHWDEPIWRLRKGGSEGMTNAEYLEVTKAIYQLGLRTFPVFTTSEFTRIEGNENVVESIKPEDGKYDDATLKINRSSLEFTTDIGWDTYSIDIRDGAGNGNIAERWKDVYPEIKDGKSYYKTLTKALEEHVGRPFNLYHFITAYTCTLWGGLDGLSRADEAFCQALLDFAVEDLKTRTYAGGVFLYSYHHGTDAGGSEQSLREFLPIKDEFGNNKYFPQTPKWNNYATRLKEVRTLFDSTKATLSPYKA